MHSSLIILNNIYICSHAYSNSTVLTPRGSSFLLCGCFFSFIISVLHVDNVLTLKAFFLNIKVHVFLEEVAVNDNFMLILI
jgi:hypothetical protein